MGEIWPKERERESERSLHLVPRSGSQFSVPRRLQPEFIWRANDGTDKERAGVRVCVCVRVCPKSGLV